MWPAPRSNTVAALPSYSSVIGFPWRSNMYAVVIIADLIAAGDQLGYLFLKSATTPDTCGVAMDVPLRKLNLDPVGPTGFGHAARMLTPGAITSGFMIPPLVKLGPRDEKTATAGAEFIPNWVPWNFIAAVGFFVLV
ncbi:hypothetical protein IEQ34_013443 [Dendrobium chrysotoxum]|uniref:Uncharacterized protein n=1 Tax=Dendrobium chrysotoxum TaxID=161865 RepID=A0AAV7GR15_DENCH|nr:hypothetical protein IEQ34_013443 [Dendrobium chrysotoxum]